MSARTYLDEESKSVAPTFMQDVKFQIILGLRFFVSVQHDAEFLGKILAQFQAKELRKMIPFLTVDN